MRNERDKVRSIVSWRNGLRPGLTFEDAELAAIGRQRSWSTAQPIRWARWTSGGG
jgi:hypothetical protein